MKISLNPLQFLLLFILLSFSMMLTFVFAGPFTTSSNVASINAQVTNQLINFTVSNNGSENITQVNITLPYGFSFVSSSNWTSVANILHNFTNNATTVMWDFGNRSVFNTTNYFAFNFTTQFLMGTFNFTVTVNDTSGVVNSTNVSIVMSPSLSGAQNKSFGVVPGTLFVNWTTNADQYQQNVTIVVNASGNFTSPLNISILNSTSTSSLVANYSQAASGACSSIKFIINNGTRSVPYAQGLLFNTGLNNTNVTLLLPMERLSCNPGRWYIPTFTLSNSSFANENVNLSVTLDIPIVVNNTLNQTTGVGTFNGSLVASTSYYHDYYFFINNSLAVLNATGVMINVSGWNPSQDVDVFLLDNSSRLVAKSINKNQTTESLTYNYFPTTFSTANTAYQIRIFGNGSSAISYNGAIYYTTLNITNASNPTSRINLIDYGLLNVSGNHTSNITLKNEGNITLQNIVESKELYWFTVFGNNIGTNFSFLMPDSSIASKVKVVLNWTGGTNYSFNLYRPTNTLVANSVNKYILANSSGMTQEEYNETTSISPSSSEIWRLEVVNNSFAQDYYNASVFIFMTPSRWFTSNYTNISLVGHPQSVNNSYTFQINLSIPNNTVDGRYAGKISYTDTNGAGINIPFRFNVTTPIMLVNSSYTQIAGIIDENYGATLQKNGSVSITNNGSQTMYVVLNSSTYLSCVSGSCSSAIQPSLNITINNAPIQKSITEFSVASQSNVTINYNVTFNSSMPTGVYEGWILINATNNTFQISPHPNATMNVTIRLNLTNYVVVSVVEYEDDFAPTAYPRVVGNTSNIDRNLTIKIDLSFVNGTAISTSALNVSNFSSVWLQEGNITSSTGRIPSSGSLNNITNYTNSVPVYCTLPFVCPGWGGDNHYYINATVPSSTPGGQYDVFVTVNISSNPLLNGTFTGTGHNRTLFVNNTGYFIQTNTSSSQTLDTSTTSFKFYTNITNLGMLTSAQVAQVAPTPAITLSESCGGWTVSEVVKSAECPSDWTFNISGGGITASPAFNGSCIVYWTVSNSTSSTTSACTGTIFGRPARQWFNNLSLSVGVTGAAGSSSASSSSSSSSSSSTSTSTSTSSPSYLDITGYTSLMIVTQGTGNSTTVTVKNINSSISQSVSLTVDTISSSWFTVDPSTEVSIAASSTKNYTVTFSVPKTADVKDYSANFKAVSTQGSATKAFTLRVLPAPETQLVIASTFTNIIKPNFTQVWSELNATKSIGANTTAAESKFKELQAKVAEAEAYVKEGTAESYFKAQQLFSTINNLIDATRNELKVAKEAQQKSLLANWPIYVAIGGGIGIAIFLAYLFWPSKVAAVVAKIPKPSAPKISSGQKEAVEEKFKELKDKFTKKKPKQFYQFEPKE